MATTDQDAAVRTPETPMPRQRDEAERLAVRIADAARAVDGVHDVGTPAGRVAASLRAVAPGREFAPGVRVDQLTGNVQVSVVADYPVNVVEVATRVRAAVSAAAPDLGRARVDVLVTDVHGPFDRDVPVGDPLAGAKAGVADAAEKAQAGAQRAAENVRAGAETAAENIKAGAQAAADGAKEGAQQVQAGAQVAAEKARAGAETAADVAREAADTAADNARVAADAVRAGAADAADGAKAGAQEVADRAKAVADGVAASSKPVAEPTTVVVVEPEDGATTTVTADTAVIVVEPAGVTPATEGEKQADRS